MGAHKEKLLRERSSRGGWLLQQRKREALSEVASDAGKRAASQ